MMLPDMFVQSVICGLLQIRPEAHWVPAAAARGARGTR